MGRPAFTGFLTAPEKAAETGVHFGAEFADWDSLLGRGIERSGVIASGRTYVVDPAAGLEAFCSLFAVATVPDTVLLWTSPATIGVGVRELVPALFELEQPFLESVDRPLWGVATSGSSGVPKIAIGHADMWELIALHYEQAIFGGELPASLATCLPLQFSAAFFMTVLPSLMRRRNLVVFPPHDWSAVRRAGEAFVLAVPSLAAAACLGLREKVDMRGVTLFLGGGHLSESRVELIRERFSGVAVANIYGTAETGAISVDRAPGHNKHVGRPLAGKAVWISDPDPNGIGMIRVAGPDCCEYIWRPGAEFTAGNGGTDYGHFDGDGNLCLQGRADGGEKFMGVLVYPRDIERHLLELRGVVDARVLVERTPTGLERLVAKVVGRVSDEDVYAHCAALAEAQRPTRIECIDEIAAGAAYSDNGKL
ncbi:MULTISPECIES: AMP-binding protein [unclassified Nocardia]|uniref:AMP-binding protein n=1 Tax=unclassified Nocardia TaxID=2637762 RepID=UPI001CE481DE|nr:MULTISPECIES: AMP-binding protein [unclassified Nocardia]